MLNPSLRTILVGVGLGLLLLSAASWGAGSQGQIWTAVSGTAAFFDDHNGAFTALFTIVLAVSTILLWKATTRSARISERALTELERPWLFLQGATVSRREAPGEQPIPNNWYIKLRWKNIGRAPALIDRCSFKLADQSTIAAQPDYTNSQEFLCVADVPPAETFDTNQIGPSPASGIKDGKPIMFVLFGRMTYRELNGRAHHTGYAVEISPHMAAFSRHINNTYDYYD
jgi:hypothetical protein